MDQCGATRTTKLENAAWHIEKEVRKRERNNSYSRDMELFRYSVDWLYAKVSHLDTYLVTVDFSTKAY